MENKKKFALIFFCILTLLVLISFISLLLGSKNTSIADLFRAVFKRQSAFGIQYFV